MGMAPLLAQPCRLPPWPARDRIGPAARLQPPPGRCTYFGEDEDRMSKESNRRHVFISHHHVDDEHVDRLTDLLCRAGYDIRNSSIRAKPANQRRLERGEVKEETIRRLLRM